MFLCNLFRVIYVSESYPTMIYISEYEVYVRSTAWSMAGVKIQVLDWINYAL